MNENELYIVEEFEYKNSLITEIDSTIDSLFKDCHNIFFHKFKYECINDPNFTNIADNEIIIYATRGKSMNLYEVNKKLTVARQNGFIFN